MENEMSNTLRTAVLALICVTGASSLPVLAADSSEPAVKVAAAEPVRVPATPGAGPDRVPATSGKIVRDHRDPSTPRASSRRQQPAVRVLEKTPHLGGHVFRNQNAKIVRAPKASSASGKVTVRLNGRR
jgi:hypothetical protein